jgi:ATP-dependent DNA helicase DinG
MKKDSKFAVVDIEATEASNENGKIIQIAIVIVENWKISKSFNTFINPGIPVPQGITNLTNITDDDVKGAPYF